MRPRNPRWAPLHLSTVFFASHCYKLWCVLSFFFSSRRRHTRSLCDWSSDVCSSDLPFGAAEHAIEPLLAAEQRRGIDPRLAAWPALHVGRRERVLAECRDREHRRAKIDGMDVESAQGAYHEVHRRFDQGATVLGGPERLRAEDRPQERLHFVARIAEHRGPARDLARIRLARDEFAPQLAADELRGLRMREEDVEDVVAVEAPALAQHRLVAVVVPQAAERELTGVAIEAPSGESARGLLHVLLAVAALAQREQLHHLAREILVGRLLAFAHVFEIPQHRRILGHAVQHGGEVAESLAPQERVRPVHELARAHPLLAGGEVAGPDNRHSLWEPARRTDHLAQPPGAQLEALLEEAALRGLALLRAHLL